MRPDEIVDALAATQHGVVARTQLLSAGLSRQAIDRRVASGRLAAMHPGVYLVRGHPRTIRSRVAAACLAAGPSAVASHRCAGQLHGMPIRQAPVEILVPVEAAPRLRAVVVHRTSAPPDGDAIRLGGLPVTSAPRTLIDLAAVLEPHRLARVLDDALFRRLTTLPLVVSRLDELGRQGRTGAGQLARLLTERLGDGDRPHTVFERRLFEVLQRAGLRLPTPQFEVILPGGARRYLDYAYADDLVAIEADSYESHSTFSDWAADHIRNRELTAMGWRILPSTWDELARPGPFLAAVARALDGPYRIAG